MFLPLPFLCLQADFWQTVSEPKSIYFSLIFSVWDLYSVPCLKILPILLFQGHSGVGGSLMTPVGKLALIKTFDKSELLKAMNFAIIPALIGPVLGPLVGGYMVDYLSWHWIFLINIPIGFLGIVLGLKLCPIINPMM
jgi:MFS family permease